MKKKFTTFNVLMLSLTSVLTLTLNQAKGQDSLITQWNTQANDANNGSFTLYSTKGTYSYSWVNVNDNTISGVGSNVSGNITITTGTPGTYRVAIISTSDSFQLVTGNETNAKLLKSVDQWGDLNWTSWNGIFDNASNLIITAVDTPNLALVKDMSYAFHNCTAITTIPKINAWNVSNVTSFVGTFYNASNFNQDLNSWNTGSALTLNSMFQGASSFNGNISSWNVSNVTDLSSLFNWASSFNQNISTWNVGNVTSMGSTFYHASNYNQPLNSWNVGNVTYFGAMFQGAGSFNQDLNSWDMHSAQSLWTMFWAASSFNGNISSWNVSNVTDMNSMFAYQSAFNNNISGWNVSNVTNMQGMFIGDAVFNQDISNWVVSNVTNIAYMFKDASSFNQNIGNWDVSAVTSFSEAFNGATNFDQNLALWNVTNGNNFWYMLNNSGLSCVNYGNTLEGWSGQNVQTGQNLGAANLQYDTAATQYRDVLVNSKSWNITGDISTPGCSAVTPLPLELISFNISKDNNANLLNWTTANEINFKGFELQRSADAKNWESIASISGKGNGQAGSFNYTYNDVVTSNEKLYYRLKMNNLDNSFTLSKILSINSLNNSKLEIFPNPTTDVINFTGAFDANTSYKLEMYSLEGKLLFTQNNIDKEVNIKHLPAAMYLIKLIENNNSTQYFKLIKK